MVVAARSLHLLVSTPIRLPLLLFALLVTLPGVATAHTRLLRTEPADNGVAAGPVHHVRLWFSTAVGLTSGGVTVTGPDGRRVDGRSARTTADDPSVVEVPLDGRAAGRYAVEWTAISADGHPIAGTFTFVVDSGNPEDFDVAAPHVVTQPPPPQPERVPVGRTAAAFARGLHYLALVIALGPLLFAGVVLRGAVPVPPLIERRAWGVAALGAALLFPAALVTLFAQTAALTGSFAGGVSGDVLAPVLSSRWGMLWQIRLGLAALLAWITVDAMLRRRAAPPGPVRLAAALAVGALLILLTAIDGHPASMPPVLLSVIVASVHLAATCAWIGGLIAMLAVVYPVLRPLPAEERGAVLGRVVPRFSSAAFAAVLVLVLTGLYQSWLLVGGPAALFGTGYGRLLLLKLGIFAMLLVPAAVNRLVVKPRLRAAATTLVSSGVSAAAASAHGAGTPAAATTRTETAAAGTFQRLVTAEVALGVAVLAVVAVLAGVAPPAQTAHGEVPAGFVFEPPLDAPEIRVPLYGGGTFDLAAERGNATLIFFGFTNCPDFCPTTLSKWTRVRAQLGDAAERTRFLFISVDPERDTPERTAAYAQAFDPSFVGIAPDSAQVARIESGFFLRSMRHAPVAAPAPAAPGSGVGGAPLPGHAQDHAMPEGGYEVMHSTRFFLIDPDGRIRVMYSTDVEAAAVAADIRRLLR